MNIINAYPTPIGTFEIENCESLNKGLTEFIYNIRAIEKGSNYQRSMAGPQGYHTKEDLLSHDNPFIIEFHQKISEKIVEYYSTITDDPMGPNTKMASWGMIYGPGDYSTPHTHPLADISSVYYCKVPDGLLKEWPDSMPGAFHYIDPRPASRWDINFATNSIESIPAKEGTGAIHPGWLEHYVTPHYLKDDRIAIATNVFIDHGTFFK